ncbi:hypothetical protein NW768_007509 [Fusarium equiseti]|uniref:NACHT domain-containing protein n=1 Tax=Fusarium equiseti TaxID=61235 RepID=A0ABQ8R7Y9_FUSEQ|nr:hypothetical protein NW768_007509 [Fusarium equiseti]
MRNRLQSLLSAAVEQEKHLSDMVNLHRSHYAWQRKDRDKEKDDNCLRDLYITNSQHVKASLLSDKGGLVHESFSWVTQHPKYTEWLGNEEAGRLLWIRGDAGKGKAMLLCGIIEELEVFLPRAVFYFFCQASEPTLRSATNVLRGLIWSLVRTRPSLISYVREDYDQTGANLFRDDNAWQSLSRIFTKILQDSIAEDCVFIIDALDECTEGMHKLIGLVSKLSMECRPKWIVSSRNWSTIERQLQDASTDVQLSLELNTDAITDAVQKFIDIKTRELALKQGYNETLRAEIHEYLVANAENMFLWVALVCTELEKSDVPFYCALEVAKSFPAGLEELYERMITVVEGSRSRTFCKAVLAVVTLAFRPVKMSELGILDKRLEAVSQSAEALSHIVSSCGSMLAVQGDTTVHIVHQQARDYLMKSSIVFPEDISQHHADMVINSMEILQKALRRNIYKLDDSTALIDEISTPSPDPLEVVKYSCIYWFDHLDAGNSADAKQIEWVHNLLVTFFTNKCLYWFEAMSLLGRVTEAIKALQKLKDIINAPEDLVDLIDDALRWALMHRSLMDIALLQLYDSALLFSPQHSLMTKHFAKEASSSFELVRSGFQDWDSCLQTIAGFAFNRPWLEFSPDRTKLATISEDAKRVLIVDASTGDQDLSFSTETKYKTLTVSYHPGGKHLATLSAGREIQIWDIDTQTCIRFFTSRRGEEEFEWLMWGIDHKNRLPFSPDGNLLAIFGTGETVDVWDVWGQAGLGRSETPVLIVIRAFEDYTAFRIDVWDSASQDFLSSPLDGFPQAVEVSCDDTTLAVATVSGINIVSWDPTLAIKNAVDDETIGKVHDLTWSLDGTSLAIATEHGITLWDLARNLEIARLSGHTSHVSTLRYGKDNQLASIGFRDHTLKIWNVNSELGHTKQALNNPPTALDQMDDYLAT